MVAFVGNVLEVMKLSLLVIRCSYVECSLSGKEFGIFPFRFAQLLVVDMCWAW